MPSSHGVHLITDGLRFNGAYPAPERVSLSTLVYCLQKVPISAATVHSTKACPFSALLEKVMARCCVQIAAVPVA